MYHFFALAARKAHVYLYFWGTIANLVPLKQHEKNSPHRFLHPFLKPSAFWPLCADTPPPPAARHVRQGSFALSTPYYIYNKVGAEADNVYTHALLQATNGGNAGKRAVVFNQLTEGGSTNPEAYRLHVTPDTVAVYASTAEGFLRAGQTLAQLTTKEKSPLQTSPTRRPTPGAA